MFSDRLMHSTFIAEGLTEITHPIFEISMTLRTWSPDAFRHVVPNGNFHCQRPLENAKFNMSVKMSVGKSGCEYRLANCDSPTGYGMHFSAVLSNYNAITAYICRRFIPTTAFYGRPM